MQEGTIKAGPPPRRENEDAWRCRTVVILLEEARQSRSLTIDEARLLSWATSRLHRKREVWRWSEREDRRLIAFIRTRKGIVFGNRRSALVGKPFEKDSAVQELADELGRTVWAVRRRIERLRKRKCSNARSDKEA